MKRQIIIFLLGIAVTRLFSQESSDQVIGRVIDSDLQPLPQVNIIIKATERGTQTDAHGEYAIVANPGEILLFSHIGMQPVVVRVERSPSVINVEMQSMSIELEGVEIEAKGRHKTQKELLGEYPSNKNLVKTTWGILDKDRSSSVIHIIDGGDLTPGGRDFLNSLQGYVPHMRIVRDCNDCPGGVGVFLRTWSYASKPTAIFDVNGAILISPPTYLSANEIDRIAILERHAAMSIYGSQGAGGVIIINTRAQNWMDDTGLIRTYDNRSLVDSLLRKATHPEPYRPHKPSFMDELLEATTEKQTLDIFAGQKESYLNNPYYFLEVYDLFLSRWGNKEKSKELFQYISNSFLNNVPVLKALAYLQQQNGDYESSLSLYLEIIKLQFGKAQAHRDVANAYSELGDPENAWIFYTQYIDATDQLPNTSFDANGDDLLITTEMMNILKRNREAFSKYNDIVGDIDHDDMHTRLVFEWNNQEAEFELQFVTPDGYFDTWNNRVVKGYTSKQFFIEKENRDLWKVNIDYKGNQSEVPIYLKVSVYHDYGLPGQQIEINVYTLWENQENVQLFKFHTANLL